MPTGAPQGGRGLGRAGEHRRRTPQRHTRPPASSVGIQAKLRYFQAALLALGESGPSVARTQVAHLVAVVIEVPGSGVADVRAYRVEGNEL
jgi:hypothetical protein